MWDFSLYRENTAIVLETGQTLSYGDLLSETNLLASNLEDRALLFCLVNNDPGGLIGYLSAINHRVVPLIASAELSAARLNRLRDLYRPQFLWAPKSRSMDRAAGAVVYEAHDYVLFRFHGAPTPQLHDSLGLLISTSGSSGSPKLVRQSYKNLLSNTDAIIKSLAIRTEDRPITSLPISYTYGLSVINTHLTLGSTIFLTNRSVTERKFWDSCRQYRVTSLAGVPYTFLLLDRLRFTQMELPDLTVLTQAGGKLSDRLNRKFAEFALSTKKKFFVMYGQVEATARISFLAPEDSLRKTGSIGKPIPGGILELIDESGNQIDLPNVNGELVYRGDNVCMGYATSQTDLLRGDDNKGVFNTGDIGYRDEEGYFFISGRKSRFVKLYGNRVGLDDVELILSERFPAVELACVGGEDLITIFVVGGIDSKTITTFLMQELKINYRAFSVVDVKQLPRKHSGKTDYVALTKLL